MATNVNSTQYAARATAATGGYAIAGAADGGIARMIPFDYSATLATGSTIKLYAARSGDTVFGVFIANAALGSPTTLAVGDGGSSTRYLAATSAATAGTMLGLTSGYTYTDADVAAGNNIVLITQSGTTAGSITGFLLVSMNSGG